MNPKHRVLLIDDEPAFLRELSDYCSRRGMHVETAGNGLDGLKKLRADCFDVAVVDLQMPRMTGLQVVEAVRSEEIDTNLIMLTGYGEKEEVVAALKLHVDDWFQKTDDTTIPILPRVFDKIKELVESRSNKVSVDEMSALVAAHAALDDPTETAIWIRRGDREAWLVEVIPAMEHDDAVEKPVAFNPGREFRHPLNLIAGNRADIENALRNFPCLARDVARGKVLHGPQCGREIVMLAEQIAGENHGKPRTN